MIRTLRHLSKKFAGSLKNKDLSADQKSQLDWLKVEGEHRSIYGCASPAVIASPQLEGYRTKAEMTIGTNLDGKPTIGFLLGCFKNGVLAVGEHTDAINVSDHAKAVASKLQDFIRQKSRLPVYDRATNSGFWRILMVRSHSLGTMAIVQV